MSLHVSRVLSTLCVLEYIDISEQENFILIPFWMIRMIYLDLKLCVALLATCSFGWLNSVTVPGSQELVKSWITSGQCCYLHLGIPCGTSSRAREIPGGPPPVRSESFPEGLSGLKPHESERVQKANSVYSFACSLILLCAQFAVEWSLEQPHRSLFWKTVWWRAVLQHLRPYFIFFANCMHGGARPKRTCLATSVSARSATTSIRISRGADVA